MKHGHESIPTGGPNFSDDADMLVLMLAVLLMLGGAGLMLAEVVSAGFAIPVIAVGIALLAIEQVDKRRHFPLSSRSGDQRAPASSRPSSVGHEPIRCTVPLGEPALEQPRLERLRAQPMPRRWPI